MNLASLLLALALGAQPSQMNSASRIVAGVAVDAAGQPINGAAVIWTLGRSRGPKRHDSIRTTSDEQGKFRLQSPAGYVATDWSLDGEVCWIQHPTHGVAMFDPAEAEIAPGESPFYRCTVAPSSEQRTTRLIDPEERLRPGELVELNTVDGPKGVILVPDEVREALSTVANENGVAVLPTKSPNWEAADFRVVSQTYGRQVFSRRHIDSDSVSTLQLTDVGSLSGNLIRRDGGPLEGVSILLSLDQAALREAQIAEITRNGGMKPSVVGGLPGDVSALTDKNGRFVFDGVVSSSYKVLASSITPSDSVAVPVASVQVGKGESKVLALTSEPTIAVHGRFNQPDAGPPVNDVVIYFLPVESQVKFSTVPDAAGQYSIRLPPGTFRAFALGVDSIADRKGDLASWKEAVVLKADDDGRELPPLTVERGKLLSGRIRTGDGAPVRRKRVIADQGGIIRAACRSDDDGQIWFLEKSWGADLSYQVRIEGKYRAAKVVKLSPLELVLE